MGRLDPHPNNKFGSGFLNLPPSLSLHTHWCTPPPPLHKQAVALVGSLIMPHNIYLHSALVQSRQALSVSGDAAKREAMRYFGIESALSLTVRQPELLSSGALNPFRATVYVSLSAR